MTHWLRTHHPIIPCVFRVCKLRSVCRVGGDTARMLDWKTLNHLLHWLGTVTIRIVSLVSQQVQVRTWGLIMMNKHDLPSAKSITSISSFTIVVTDWALERWLSWDTTVILISHWSLQSKVCVTCPLFLHRYKIILRRRKYHTIIPREEESVQAPLGVINSLVVCLDFLPIWKVFTSTSQHSYRSRGYFTCCVC